MFLIFHKYPPGGTRTGVRVYTLKTKKKGIKHPDYQHSPHCPSPSAPTAAPQETHLLRSGRLHTAARSSASSASSGAVMSLRAEQLVLSCGHSNLQLNELTTVEMQVDFRRMCPYLYIDDIDACRTLNKYLAMEKLESNSLYTYAYNRMKKMECFHLVDEEQKI